VASGDLVLAAAAGAAVAGANALVSSVRGVYDWRRPSHVAAFALDSTWNLIGTSAALLVHGINALQRDSRFNDALSRGASYHVYDAGFSPRRGFAFTFGNVVTNARGRADLVQRHEALHVWQQRVLGPAYPLLYGCWMVGGAVVGAAVWLRHRDERLFSLVETAAYYDNPFEYWAYRRQGHWPPGPAHPRLAWPPRARSKAASPALGAMSEGSLS
jgi:hypothetical protein